MRETLFRFYRAML